MRQLSGTSALRCALFLLALVAVTSSAQAAGWTAASGVCLTGTKVGLVVQPTTGFVFVAVQSETISCRGVYRSVNQGLSFQKVGISNPGYTPPRLYDLSASISGAIYAATDQGIWTTSSTNSPVVWTQHLGGLPNFNEIDRVNVISRSGSFYDDVYATISLNGNPNGGLWRSVDSANTFTQVKPNLFVNRVTRSRGCAAAPVSNEQVVVASVWSQMGGLQGGLWISQDNGLTWAASSSWPTARANDVAFDCYGGVSNPNYGHLFVTNGDPAAGVPVYRSINLGQTFVNDFVGSIIYSTTASNIRVTSDPALGDYIGAQTADALGIRHRFFHPQPPALGTDWWVFGGSGYQTPITGWTRADPQNMLPARWVIIGNNKVYVFVP